MTRSWLGRGGRRRRPIVYFSLLGALLLVALGGASSVALASSSPNLVAVNSGFEAPTVISDLFDTYTPGTVPVGFGWSVDSGSIDHISGYWLPSEKFQSIDLDGNGAGAVSQNLMPTVNHRSYDVIFQYSANPDFKSPCVGAGPSMDVKWNGVPASSFTHAPLSNWTQGGSLDWSEGHVSVTGTGSDTLTFASNDANDCPYGIALDAVSVTAAATTFQVSYPSSTKAGDAHDLTVTALDPDGNVATGYRGTVHLTSSDGSPFPATLAGDYTFTAADSGAHTFPSGATLFTSGIQSITATDTSSSSITGSTNVTVLSAAAATLVFSDAGVPFNGQPIDTKNGAPTFHSCAAPPASPTNPCALPPNSAPVSVLARDAYDNRANNPSLTTTVKLTATSTSQVLDGGENVDANGVASFPAPAPINAGLGTYTLTATVTTSPAVTVTSNRFQLVADLVACVGKTCENSASTGQQSAYGKITTGGLFDPYGVLFTTQFFSGIPDGSKCGGTYAFASARETESRVFTQSGNISGSAPFFTIALIVPKASLQASGYTNRSVNGFEVCAGATWVDASRSPSAWTAKKLGTKPLQLTPAQVDSGDPLTYWGWAPNCSDLSTTLKAAGNPCIKLRTKEADDLREALRLTSAQVAALPFKSGDLAIVVTEGYPWDGRFAGP